jgi:hypothetical protein
MKTPIRAANWSCHAPTSLLDADGKYIAECGGLNGEDSAESARRAEKIAACVNTDPRVITDLLEALKAMLADYGSEITDPLIIDKAEAAIAKAERGA